MGTSVGLQAGILVLCAAVISAGLQNTRKEAQTVHSCVTECTGSRHLQFQKGHRYSYRYISVTKTSLQGSIYNSSGISLACTTNIDVQDRCRLVLKLQNVQMKSISHGNEETLKGIESIRDKLEKHPLLFSFQDGKIPKICAVAEEENWVLNIKRGILSILQNSYASSEKNSLQETDVSGHCPTNYRTNGSFVWKTKQLNRCSQRSVALTSLHSVMLPDKSSHQRILDSHLECTQKYKNGVLENANCTESNLLTPFSRKGHGAKIVTRSALYLFKRESEISSYQGLGDLNESTLLYELKASRRTEVTEYPTGQQVAETVRKLCITKVLTSEATELFMTLVFELRTLSFEALRHLWQMASFKCRDDWQPLVDALPACGTEPCVSLMKEIIISKEVEDEKVESFLQSLPFISDPTSGMISTLADLLHSSDVSQSLLLGISSIVHTMCSRSAECETMPEIQAVMKTLEKYLGGDCRVTEPKDIRKVQLVLKAIGNAGQAAASLIPTLSNCASSQTQPSEIRLAAIEAFRRIPCSADRSVLMQLYQTLDDGSDIRIASYYTAMRCPSKELFDIIRQTLQHETSTQVNAFVWSHLTQIMETSDPVKQQLRNSLPDDIINKDFDTEVWKYSFYRDATFQTESSDTNVEASIVYSPKSFIPRFLMTNLTVHVLGQSVNLLELAVQLENAEPIVQKLFGFQPPVNPVSEQDTMVYTPDGNLETNDSPSPTVQQKERRKTSKRDNHENPAAKPEKNKQQKARQRCQNDDFIKINEIEQKFVKQSEQSKQLRCSLGVKVFGNELIFLDCDDLKKQIKQYSLNLAELTVKLLKGQEVQYNKRFSLATEELMLPTVSGIPIKLALNSSAATNVRVKGNVDFKQWSDFHLKGYIKPSAVVQVAARMGITGIFGEHGLEWITTLRTSTSLDGGVQLKKGQEIKIFFNTPEESMDIFDISSKLYVVNAKGSQEFRSLRDRPKTKSCTDEDASKLFGWQLCFDVSRPEVSTGLPFPLSGSSRAAVFLKKQDKGLQQYLLEAAYNYTQQIDTWIPNEANLHFLMGTPKSDIKRDVSIDISFNYFQKKFLARLVHPKKTIQLEGKLEVFRNSRIGYIQLLLDDKDVYFVKVMADMHTLKAEQHYLCQLDLKLTKQGFPIILSGNFTKHMGKKMVLSVSLSNVLKDTASISVVVERKMDEKLKRYSFDMDLFLPGVVGSRAIGLLQQKGNSWSNAVRIKYGLLGAAKHLQHECNTGQEIKLETGSTELYRVEAKHELQCTQFPLYNHKVHVWHEETTSWIQSQLELSYGKHWDEINNKRKLMITQTFRNNSNAALANYFLEFTLQLPARQLNYRTQLQHTHSLQGHTESNTNFKVQYNDRMPFVVGLHWKDTSKLHFKKWDGTINMDTPWLYLYIAHKLNQPQRGAYQSNTEVTSGKAISIKNLVMNAYYKDSINDKEGRIHIYSPSATYLKASTYNHIEGNIFRSYSEIASLWNQPLKTDLYLENSDRTKAFVLKIRGAKQEFNFTADYMNLAELRKTNLSVRCTWTDRKSLPVVVQLDGRVEELKRLKMFYQKQASLHFRHPFKLPVPQSFFLQETFTVNKKKKHYILETKALFNGIDETVQTLTLGYQKKNPYICAGLVHPYNNKIVPKNMEMCVRTRHGQNMKYEAEAVLKVKKKDILHFLGKYQNRSNDGDFWHIAHLDMSHGFQMKFPHTIILDGEIFSKNSTLQGFDYGVMGRVTLNKRDTSQFSAQMSRSSSHISLSSQLRHPYHLWVPQTVQAHVTGRHYGDSNFNGTLYFTSSRRRMISVAVDVTNEIVKHTKTIGVTANIHQTLSAEQIIYAELKGNCSNSRIYVDSGIKVNNKSLQMNVVGSKEQKAGLTLSLQGSLQHNLKSLGIIPQHVYMDGSLLHKHGIHEGNISVEFDNRLYGLQFRNRHSYGNNSVHNFILVVRQNGSAEVPGLTDLKGRLELSEGTKEGQACLQVDDRKLCVEVGSINNPDQSGLTGKVTHNIHEFENAGVPTNGSFLLLYDHISHNRRVTAAMKSGKSHIEALIGIERMSPDSPKCQMSARVQHNIHDLKKLGVPFLTTGSCFYQNSRNQFAARLIAATEKEHVKVELEKKTSGSVSEFTFKFCNSIEALVNLVPSTVQVNCSGSASAAQIFGACSGEAEIKPSKAVTASLNGSFLIAECSTNLISHVSVDNRFAQLTLQTGCNPRHSIQLGFRHSILLLQSLSIPAESKVKVEADTHHDHKALIDIIFGHCSVKVAGEAKNRNHGVDMLQSSNWSASLINDCPALKRVGIPQSLGTNVSFFLNKCNVALNGSLIYDGKSVNILLETICDPQYVLSGRLQHSVTHLSDVGLPNENKILLSTTQGPRTEGSLLLEFGKCTIKVNGDLKVGKKTEWMWKNENECQLLQDFSIPAHSQFKGNFQSDACNAELSTVIVMDGNSACLEVKSSCHPELNAEISFQHNMSFLKSIPEENKLSIRAGNRTKYEVSTELKSGSCILESSGDFQFENKLRWKLVMDNKCKQFQDYGIPLAANGSGHIVLNQTNLDSQIILNADTMKLKGSLVMTITDMKQEMDASLSQNIQVALNLGIPANTMLDLSSEKSGDLYHRLIKFRADNKQITEELSCIQKQNQIALNYKLTHNMDTLRNLMIEDKIDIQADLALNDVKSFTLRTQYGSRLITLEGHLQNTEGKTDFKGTLQHNWPQLLQSGVPASLQIASSLQGSSSNLEGSIHAQFGEMSILCAVNCYLVGQQFELVLKNRHYNERLHAAGFAKTIDLAIILEKQGSKILSNLKGRYDEKGLAIHMNTSTSLEDGKPLGLNVNIEHSIPLFKKFGLPFRVQVDSSTVIKDAEFEGSLKLYYEPKANLIVVLRARNQQSSKAFHYTMSQNIPFLFGYLPSMAEIAPEVKYFPNKIESKLLAKLQQHELHASSTITSMEFGYSEIFDLSHTFPQVTHIPKQLTSTTVYQKFNRTHSLSHTTLWDSKEMKFMGTYTGLFPKVFGSHELKVDLLHPFNIPLPHQLKLNTHLAHSTHHHQDDIIFGWNGRQQVVVLSSLKFGRERLDSKISLKHPFDIDLRQMEFSCLSESRGQKSSHQAQIAWNGGKAIEMKLAIEDKSIINITLWDACITISSGQLQSFLSVGHIYGCGSVKQVSNYFTEQMDLNWDGRKVKQRLEFERRRPTNPDHIQLEATLENIFQTMCSRQEIVGKLQTDYHSHLGHYMSVHFCDLPDPIMLSGWHQLNLSGLLLQSEIAFSLYGNQNDSTITVSFRNDGQADVQNYSIAVNVKATEDIQLGMQGQYSASENGSHFLLLGENDKNEKVKMMASKMKGCLKQYTEFSSGDVAEEAFGLEACSDGKQEAHVSIFNSVQNMKQNVLAHLALAVTNQSLSVSAQGCGRTIIEAEKKLGSHLTHLKASVLKKIKQTESYIWEFRQNVQHIGFLYELARWSLETLEELAKVLETGERAVAQKWKLSILREILTDSLPLYFTKVQDILQQLQDDLQKPVSTLKDAYFEVTSKPLDEVLRERTDEFVWKIRNFMTSVVKDAYLLKPVQVTLQAVKTGLDVTMHQVLKWMEAKVSRAFGSIRKPLSNFFRYSPHDCLVTINFPVMPQVNQFMDLANFTNYLIEHKIMGPIRDLYSINAIAEYYRLKKRLMESPFEYHAILIGDRHVVTFDGEIYDFISKCTLLLAKDFAHNAFTMFLNQESGSVRSVHVMMNQTAFDIFPGQKVDENCKHSDLQLMPNGVTIRREANRMEVSNQNGVTVSCDVKYDICSITLSGWYHGVSAGLFGTNDNEAGNEFQLPNHSQAHSVQEFTEGWQVNQIGVHCHISNKSPRPCPPSADQRICKTLFRYAHSPLRNCFRVVDPAPFYAMCITDMCESTELKPACSVAAAFVHLCNRDFVPLEIPSQCISV